MSTHYIKSFDNYFKLVDETQQITSLVTSSYSNDSGSNEISSITIASINDSARYEGIKSGFLTSSLSASYTPQIITQTEYETIKEEIKNYYLEII
tara:strand:- start:655 stop:939 length:285 start_codon:yes stop_codon:yes gene_type:complete